jgi:hypothetical protein
MTYKVHCLNQKQVTTIVEYKILVAQMFMWLKQQDIKYETEAYFRPQIVSTIIFESAAEAMLFKLRFGL